MKIFLSLLVLVTALAVRTVHSMSAGPPLSSGTFDTICNRLMPSHTGNAAQSGTGGYIVSPDMPRSDSDGFSYAAGQIYTVTLTGSVGSFRGFLVTAHVPGETGMLLGRFIPQNDNQQTLDCDAAGASSEATITHSNSARTDFTSMTFMWEAPAGSDGTVDFRYSVVKSFAVFYVRQSAAENSEFYRLNFSNPEGCERSECLVFVGINTNTNSSYLDIYLEGEADGWVAVGFSESRNMSLADVVACNRDPATGMIEGLDAWNRQGNMNEIDVVQDVQLVSGNYSEGRIMCSVSKKIAPSGTGQDLDLDNDYYVLFGRRRGDSNSGSLSRHEIGAGNNPNISSEKFNPVKSGVPLDDGFPRIPLLRFHGILMLIAWPLLAKIGIFFAAWMRPALPKGEWFQVHRAFLLTSMFIGAAGFVVAFIANYPSGLITFQGNRTGTVHFVFGILVMLVHIINPIISIFRCKPKEKNRWIFNLMHGSLLGTIGVILAITNVALGTSLISGLSALFWVFIAYVIFDFVYFIGFVVVFTIKACISKDQEMAPSMTKGLFSSSDGDSCEKDVQLEQVGSEKQQVDSGDKSSDEKPKVPSKDAPLRWVAVAIYMVVSVGFVIAAIVLLAVLDL